VPREKTFGTARTRGMTDNGGVVVNVFYKHSWIKQYLKDGRAMRTETVMNAPRDLGCNARLPNLEDLQAKACAANQRILGAERVGQGCVLASPRDGNCNVGSSSCTCQRRRLISSVRSTTRLWR
jgi:hypothetical protein